MKGEVNKYLAIKEIFSFKECVHSSRDLDLIIWSELLYYFILKEKSQEY